MDTGREWIPAVLNDKHYTPRSCIVTTGKGQTLRRNKSAIKSSHETDGVNSPYLELSKSLPATESSGSSQQGTPIEDTPINVNPPTQPDSSIAVARQELGRSKRTIKAPNWQKDYIVGTP